MIKDNKFSGANHGSWKGGRYIAKKKGYVFIYCPDHPTRNVDNYVPEHRLVMEKHIGRYVKPKEVVHHINSNPSDNRIENLMLLKNNKEHRRIHAGYKRENGKWFKFCKYCNRYLLINGRNFYIYKKTGAVGTHCKKHIKMRYRKNK